MIHINTLVEQSSIYLALQFSNQPLNFVEDILKFICAILDFWRLRNDNKEVPICLQQIFMFHAWLKWNQTNFSDVLTFTCCLFTIIFEWIAIFVKLLSVTVSIFTNNNTILLNMMINKQSSLKKIDYNIKSFDGRFALC